VRSVWSYDRASTFFQALLSSLLPKMNVLTLTGAPDDFQARSPDELSLAKGDRIELIERDDDFGDGWFLGKHLQNTMTGLFPEGENLNNVFDGLSSSLTRVG